MRLSKRQLKRIIREEYSRLKRRGLIREGNFDKDPIEDAWWCVSETCEIEEGSTQITHDLHYVAEQFDLDQMLSRYIQAGEPCTYDDMGGNDTAGKWKEFLLSVGSEGPALATAFSEFWERNYMN